ncbi:MAG: thiamine-phosphate kinase, partial [Thermoplasmata archaeon]|nr:thiamine-phosphate kinase [Thermoplasmata archaeon]
MRLRDIGERRAIEIMAERYGSINLDDCATIDAGDEFFLVTTDMVNEKTHFPEGTTPYRMGWFVVAINLSDIAAKGGTPAGVTLSLGLPPDKNVDFIREFSKG